MTETTLLRDVVNADFNISEDFKAKIKAYLAETKANHFDLLVMFEEKKMKLHVGEEREIILTEVFNGVRFKTNDGEEFGVCMSDSGYEFDYMGTSYEAKEGVVREMNPMFSSKQS